MPRNSRACFKKCSVSLIFLTTPRSKMSLITQGVCRFFGKCFFKEVWASQTWSVSDSKVSNMSSKLSLDETRCHGTSARSAFIIFVLSCLTE